MEERIVKFISALRSAGLRVSLAETEDAFRAIEQMGVQEKVIFRTSLRSTLVKEEKNLSVFDELFPLFFGESGNPPMMNLSEDLTPEEEKMKLDVRKAGPVSFREKGTGRPTKKERRIIDRWKDDFFL